VLKVLAGDAASIDDEDARLLDRGLGLDLARAQSLAGADPWLSGDIRDDVAGIAAMVDGFVAAASLPEPDLCELRDYARALASLMADVSCVLQPTSGRFAFGIAHLGPVLEDMLSTPDDQARTVAMLAALCARGLRPGLETILQSAQAAREGADAYNMLVAIRTAIPRAADVVSDHRFGAALRDSDRARVLRDEIASLRSLHADEIDAVVRGGRAKHERGSAAPSASDDG
jgi:hypothetical protein